MYLVFNTALRMGDHDSYHLSSQCSNFDDSHYTEEDDADLETNGDEDVLLISLVQSYPHLYNTELEDFKDAAKKEYSWREIAAIAQMDVDVCQKRWRRLREQYSREKKKRELKTITGSGASKRKPFMYFDNMQFLKRFVKRRTMTNMQPLVCRPKSSEIVYSSDDSLYNEEHDADMETNEDTDELLISLVQDYPHLYNKELEDFKDVAKKENSWREIASIIQMNVDVCQKRWRRLREQYSREKKKQESKTSSGSGSSKRKPFMYFDNMQFLKHFVKRRRTMTKMRPLVCRPSSSGIVYSKINFNSGPALNADMSDDVSFCQYVLTTITMMPESEKADMKKKILRTLLNL